jgi:hypothetical protein
VQLVAQRLELADLRVRRDAAELAQPRAEDGRVGLPAFDGCNAARVEAELVEGLLQTLVVHLARDVVG